MEEISAYFLTYRFFFYLLIVTLFLGLQFFRNLPQALYNPTLLAFNVLSGIFLIFEIRLLGNSNESDTISLLLGFFSILLISTNLVGGIFFIEKQAKIFKSLKK